MKSTTKNYADLSVALHKKYQGKMSIAPVTPIETLDDLSTVYTPGVAEPCRIIAENKERSFDLTWRGRTVAVVSDGSAVLGLGNIGPEAAMPVMEGKCLLFKEFGGVDALPICLDTQDTDEIVETVVRMAPSFGGINLEDISAPRCFEIEAKLKERLNIPIFHDDQHGTAIVVVAAMKNALKVVNKKIEDVKIVISGAGAAGIAIAKLIMIGGGKNIVMTDSKGVIGSHRNDLNSSKQDILAEFTRDETGDIHSAMNDADVFIGVSKAGIINKTDIQKMNKDAIVFAMANPTPEIFPDEARAGGARIVATGRSDFANQVNNVVAFPGLFAGLFAIQAKSITPEIFMIVADAIASTVENPSEENIIPSPLDKSVAENVKNAVINFSKKNAS